LDGVSVDDLDADMHSPEERVVPSREQARVSSGRVQRDLRELDASSPDSCEQLNAKFAFESEDLSGCGGLAQVQLRAGFRETAGVGDDDKGRSCRRSMMHPSHIN
jgi:hypothetical protein